MIMAMEYKLPYTASEIEDKLGQIDNIDSVVEAALTEAKASGEFDGADGLTPHINADGNWQIGETNTGIKAEGSKGSSGVYVGSGEMPEDCNVQIDPTGEPLEVYNKSEIDIKVGNIETALDAIIAEQEAIIAIQNALIGGGNV